MNRIFKVIWSRTKGCYVVVAETAKNMSKRFVYVRDVPNDRAWEYYCARGRRSS